MGVKKRPVSPRQKMINLMYVILMAMLAMNVSSDVLKGFSLVEESLNRSTKNATAQNENIYASFDEQMKANPVKVKEWFEKAQYVKNISDSLYNLTEELKVKIVREVDGEEGDVNNIKNKENLEAASHVMLSIGGKGKLLRKSIDDYRSAILAMITDESQKKTISDNLSTTVPKGSSGVGKNWEEYMFEGMPAAAAVTLLTKLQNDVRYAEGEVLHQLVSNIGVKDIRVNSLNAYVIPSAQTVVQGGKFSAQIIMAAVDTTQRPIIHVGGKTLNSSLYETVCNTTGDFSLKGYIETVNANGDPIVRNFEQKYSVVAPSATVSADLMNVLYAGYSNPMSVSIPGVPVNKIIATMQGGTLTSTGPGKYVAIPQKPGSDAVITVSTDMNGRVQQMGQYTFHVRKLPDPIAFIDYKEEGGTNRFRGGKIAKAILMNTDGIGAAIDDGLLNISFKVLGFETIFFDNMGNAVPETSNSAAFTARQKELFRKLNRGKRFYISNVRAVGPDGIERKLAGATEVIIN
jgi:gliding motility-associated protein GldM